MSQNKFDRAVKEFRILGPPGCGKTSELSRRVEETVRSRGSESVLVMSLTRTAAAEVAGRDLPIDASRIGTLHSHAYRCLDANAIANDRKHLDQWNEYAERTDPKLRITEGLPRDDFGGSEDQGTVGDELFALMDECRSRMLPRELWRSDVRQFAELWDGWKERSYLLDFTDLVETCLRDVSAAPGNPDVIFLDEAQDFSKLELALARKWGEAADKLVIAGDPDQSIFVWRGADAKNFMEPDVPEENYIELHQSHRVPKAPHRVAVDWIRQIKDRRDVNYLPTSEPGNVEHLDIRYNDPEYVFRDAERHLASGKSVMFLATASYLLKPIVSFLRREGIAFHNPYVEKRGDWNPLRSRKGTRSVADRIRAFLLGEWLEDPDELRAWLDLLKLEHFRAERAITKQYLKELQGPIGPDELGAIFEKDALTRAFQSDLDWLRTGLLKQYASGGRAAAFDYACRIAKRSGERALAERPKTIVGTVHCSPPDEPVLTVNRGYVPISDLIPNFDSLVGYNAKCNSIGYGRTNNRGGYDFEKSVRQYSGDLITLRTSASQTRVTPNHRVRVRFAANAKGKFVVYLMRRNRWWRIGVTRAPQTGTNTSVGANTRLAREKGDGAWVLRLCETRKEALMYEALIGGRYGIPGLIFESTPSSKTRTFTSPELHRIHAELSDAVAARVAKLFTDFGLDAENPIWSGDGRVRAGYGFETVAANVVSGLMELPIWRPDRTSPDWMPVTSTRKHYDGLVYGLHVPPHEHYVSGGAIVHNSVKGGEADVVYVFPDLSRAASDEWFRGEEGRESVIRVMYVAFTRARDTLVLCDAATSRSVDFPAVA